MDEFEKLMAMVAGQAEDALEETAKRADLTTARDAEHIAFLMKILCYTEKLMGGGYSGNGDYSTYQSGNGYSGTNGMNYVRAHYSRRRDSNGRYARKSMQEYLDEMERDATSQDEREKIKKMRQMIR